MHPSFAEVVASLEPAFQKLLAASPCDPLQIPRGAPKSAIYLLSENDAALYVGRTKRLRERLGNHCRPGANHKKAAFAFRLAREATGNLRATYRREGSRSALMDNAVFASAFGSAKERIRAMQVRFVEETDPIRQTILEVYAAVSLGTPYNDFETH